MSEEFFTRVKAVRKLSDALEQLRNGIEYDVLLVSASFAGEAAANFVADARQSDGGKDAAYISVLPSHRIEKEDIAFSIMDGSDGFLFSPFSVSSLREVARVAEKVKREKEKERYRAAITLLLDAVMQNLDMLALAKFLEKEDTNYKKGLDKAIAPIRKLDASFMPIYFELLAEILPEQAEPRPELDYEGPSQRVRKMLERRLMDHDAEN
jgi:CheY-like chemotaxis protein